MATFPVGLATLINMTVLVCVPAWGNGMAIFAWVLWWIDVVLALATCFHFTFVMYAHPTPRNRAHANTPQNDTPTPRPRRDDRALPHPHRRRRHRRHVRRPRGWRAREPHAPAVDARRELRPLGHRLAALVDRADALFLTHDSAQAAAAGGHCEFVAADRAAESVGFCVSCVT